MVLPPPASPGGEAVLTLLHQAYLRRKKKTYRRRGGGGRLYILVYFKFFRTVVGLYALHAFNGKSWAVLTRMRGTIFDRKF